MRAAELMIAALLAASDASAFSVAGELAARGWFMSATGTADGTDLAKLGFDDAKGAPEFRGELVLAERHHLGITYLRIRRDESAVVSGTILGIIRFDDPVDLDVSIDDVRGHYGYSVLASRWLDLQPFLELAYLHGEVTTKDLFTTSHADKSIVLPMPGLELVVAPAFPVHLKARAEGMGVGQGHLVDVQGGAEAQYAFFFAGLGYRHADLVVNEGGTNGRDLADARLKGLYVEGGWRF